MRKKLRVSGALLIILAIIIMQLPVEPVEAADSGSFVTEGMSLTSYKGNDKTVLIPSGVETVGKKAFENNRTMEKVIFPGSLKRIGAYAFWGCDALTEISFGQGLTEVSDYAFTNCKGIKKVTIPSNISYIGIQAFADCVNLTDITIPASVEYIHETAFDGCSKLVIHCVEGSYASRYAKDFYRRQAEFAEYEDIPERVPEYLPPEEEGISQKPEDNTDQSADAGNLLGTTGVVGNHAVVFINNQDPTVHQGILSREPEFDPEKHRPVKYRIVDGRCVADQACYRDTELKEILLPEGIREIGEFAFARSSAEKLVLPDGVEKIAYGAFYHCDNLAAVRLPDTLETVEPRAFDNTLWVKNFQSGKAGEQGDFLVSGGVLVAYRGEQEEVLIPQGVRVIAAQCFQGCETIRKVVLPSGLKNIGEGAFENCSSLGEIVWNNSIERISDRAFAGCAVKEVTLGASVKYLGVGVFDPNVTVRGGESSVSTVYETSAQRLSNESYREPLRTDSGDDRKKGVFTEGMDGAGAELAGADDLYTLQLREEKSTEKTDRAVRAFARNLGAALPGDAVCLSCTFSDSSGIPITKLGKQVLTVSVPVPANLAGKEVVLYMYDRNGQLDEIPVRYSKRGENYFWNFDTTKVYDLIVVPSQTQVSEILVENFSDNDRGNDGQKDVQITAQTSLGSSGGMESVNDGGVTLLRLLKWSVGGVVLLAGLFLALARIR